MKTTAAIAAILTTLAASADVQALYWQVTSEMNPTPIAFLAAAMVAEDGDGKKVYLADAGGSAWQAANSDYTTEAIASILGQDYSSGWTFFIELQNQDGSGNWYEAGKIDNGGSNYSWADISSHVFSSSSMSMSMATPLTSGTAHIPEPTSGLLLLLGGSLLALRRRV